ncbi:MAG: transposase, partial [Verrucomicrobiota bacterium]
SGVQVLTYAIMSNHFHVLVQVPAKAEVSDEELLRRYRVLYPKPTKYQTASVKVIEATLEEGGEEAEAIRKRLLARMGDVSEFMKTLKQRFTIWFNKTHERFGTLWAERFKSVLVEGQGNPLQTMAAYIDLNPVRAGFCKDPKDYRYCGYAEAVAQSKGSARAHSTDPGQGKALAGLRLIWAAYADGSMRDDLSGEEALRAHRSYLFLKGSEKDGGMDREAALKVLEKENGILPKAAALRCRVRYFTDGAILGSSEFVRSHAEIWQRERGRKHLPKVREMRGADWGGLAVIRGLRRRVFQ